MAETVHLTLKANGIDIKGESSQTSLGRDGTIECLAYEQGVVAARDPGTGLATGRRKYRPIKIRKRIDSSSPLLFKALCNNEKIEGKFDFFRPHPDGTGASELFYSVSICEAYVDSVTQMSEDVGGDELSVRPPLEEITFVYSRIEWGLHNGGPSHDDSWREGR